MKDAIKRVIPEPMIAWTRGVQADVKLRRETIRQMKRFRRNYVMIKHFPEGKRTCMSCRFDVGRIVTVY